MLYDTTSHGPEETALDVHACPVGICVAKFGKPGGDKFCGFQLIKDVLCLEIVSVSASGNLLLPGS